MTGGETYGGFYLYIALVAAYFMPRLELLAIVGVMVIASGVPLLYGDGPAVESLVHGDAVLARAERSEASVALLYVDLDRFKLVKGDRVNKLGSSMQLSPDAAAS
ncbi:MAG: hypothetical protein ACRDL0_05670 [Thermoleophilaceae bacterium]